jgi:hypothetical protein
MNTEYRIIITNETTEEKSSPIAPTDQGAEPATDTSGKGVGGGGESKETTPSEDNKKAKGFVAFKKIVAPFVKNAMQYQISTVSLRTGNNELQSRLQASYNIGNQVASFAESTIIGGLVSGNPIGAVMGAVMSVLNTTISIAQKLEVFNIQRSMENTSIALMNIRAGGNVATTSGRRR